MSTNNIITIKLVIDGKEATATLDTTQENLKKIVGGSKDVTDSMSKWGMIVTGFRQSLELAQQAVEVFKGAMMDAATEQAMRDSFKGTAEDIDLLRKATAGTVTEGNLLRLSNQATELGLSMKDQALLFSLSEKAAIKMGVGTEEAFQRIVYASEGNTRGLRTIGIQVSEYNKIVNNMLKAQGETISTIDPEILKRIRLDAVIKLSGITLEDLDHKILNDKEKLQILGVTVEETKESFGRFINNILIPFISTLTESGDASKIMIGGLVSISSFVVPMIPILTQFRTAQALLATQSLATAGALDAEAASARGLMATFALPAAVGIGLGVGLGVGIDYLKNKHDDKLHDSSAYDNQISDNSKNLGWINNSRYVPGEGTYNISDKSNTTGNTVEDIEKKISTLQNQRKSLVAGSKELLDLDKQIATLQELIKPPSKDNQNVQNNLTQEIVKTEELKGKLEQLKTLRDSNLTQYEKDTAAALNDYQIKIKTSDTEIEGIKKVAAEKKKNLTSEDLQKIQNDSLAKQVALEEYDKKILDLTRKHQEEQLTLEYDYNDKLLQLEDKSDIERLQKKQEFYLELAKYENDPGKLLEIERKVNLTQAEIDKNISEEKKKYIEQVKYLDADYLSFKTKSIDIEAAKMRAAGLSEIQIALYKNDAIKHLEKDYYDWKWKKYQDDHKLFAGSLNAMWAGYDTFFQSITDKSISGKERLNAVWDSIKGSFISMLTDMAKQYLQGLIANAIIRDTAKAAEVTSATATGTALAAAYAPAAAFASVMSFGGADMAGSAGLAATTSLAYLLSIPKLPGFREGSVGLVGEDGPEIIAPLDTYAQGQAQLILSTMATVKSELRSGNQASIYTNNNSDVVKEIKTLHSKIEDLASRPSRAYLDDREAHKTYLRGSAINRKSKL